MFIATAILVLACSSTLYAGPTEGPTATIAISSTCTRRADFYARIDGVRTETYGCNQTASWQVTPGQIDLVVQAQESRFAVDPLEITITIGANQCAMFLLRQHEGYDLEFFGVGECQ